MKIEIYSKNSKSPLMMASGINRPIKPNQVTKLSSSIEKMGCIRPIVIAYIDFLPIKGKYIIDGQHLYLALMRLDIDFPCVEIPIKNKQEFVETLALLNASSISWKLLDYILAWSSFKSDYIKLMQYFNTYDFDITLIAAALMGIYYKGFGGSENVTKHIKRGTFIIQNENNAKNKFDYLTDVLKTFPRTNRMENRFVCSEYLNFLSKNMDKYNHDVFIKTLKSDVKRLELASQEPKSLESIFETYLN